MYDFLKKVPLFANLPMADLERLCEMIDESRLPAGAELFAEGDAGDKAYVIKEGEIDILKQSAGREVLLAVRQAGEVIGEMSLLEEAPRTATARARTESVLLAITQAQLDHLLNTSPSAARAMLHTVTTRWMAMQAILQQSEKMAQLGTLTAGIAHELNNPAAAAQRGAGQLRAAVGQLQHSYWQLSERVLSPSQLESLRTVDERANRYARQPFAIDPLGRSDREYELETWLDEQGVENAWEVAPTLVNLGYETSELDHLRAVFGEGLAAVFTWLVAAYTVYSLLEEIGQGAGRLAEIVKALKSYTYLDQAPVQLVDVHEGLDNTLIMLRGKLKGGITVHRQYAQDLPRIQAYASELNQVWTNIIDNAADAMPGQGQLTLRTHQEDNWVVVEIEDNGTGIPEAIQSKIFDPFFTTKPPGKGSGLGLNISYNIIVHKHRGEIKVFSRPGKTCFEVRLPVNSETTSAAKTADDRPPTATGDKASNQSESPTNIHANPPDPRRSRSVFVTGVRRPDDDQLREIFRSAHHVAVVGISGQPDRPAHTVPAYLQTQGYHIIPVNPHLDEVLGERAYPDLAAVPEPVDVVQIFRRSEAVMPIVEQAIEKGAKVIWMQEGIVNEPAAQLARDAGLAVVMDACMRVQHKRVASGK
ncbi:MAG: CoA-binding protein [Chloroflexota bacterium]